MFEQREYPKQKWARILGVSRSGYCAWKKPREERAKQEETYSKLVAEIFEEGKGTYGAKRICGIIRKRGHKASFYKAREIMKRQGLRCVHCKRRQRSLTNSRKSRGEGYPNLVRGMEITEPLQVLTSDISYIRTGAGFDYICQILDIKSGIVLAESMCEHIKAKLGTKTIRKAFKRWRLPKDCIFHSDRGSQYTSKKVKNLLAANGIRQSFSRVGKPGDNTWSESFFVNLKKETVHWMHFGTREEARQRIFEHIEGFYNTRRAQKRLGYLSPIQWLKQWEQRRLVSIA